MNDDETTTPPWSAADDWPPGWYADPWQDGRERRWTGNAWTSETRGAIGPNIGGLGGSPSAPPAPQYEPATTETAATPIASRWTGRRLVALVAVLSAIALVVGFVAAYAEADTSNAANTPTTVPTQPLTPGTNPSPGSTPGNGFTPPLGLNPGGEGTPGSAAPGSGSSGGSGNASGGAGSGQASSDASANVLRGLVVRQSDVTQPNSVALSDGGDSVAGVATLDLCNGTYPSESLRTARLQVDLTDGSGNPVFSTEAVLYRDANATSQAFSELRSVVAHCPSTPVASPVGEPSVTTKFNGQPDTNWPQVSGVERQAYDFTQTDDTGTVNHGIAVYLRRGRALVGLYFQSPNGAQASVDGKTTIPSIVGVFAQRLAAAPASTIGA